MQQIKLKWNTLHHHNTKESYSYHSKLLCQVTTINDILCIFEKKVCGGISLGIVPIHFQNRGLISATPLYNL